jgi:CubicO group peptidase (beta-lactamase class C family)
MLLAHQSSLGDREISTFLFFSFLNHDRFMLEEYLVPGGSKYTPKVWRDYAPGEKSYYSSLGFEILGYLVELISNQSFEKYCKINIFELLDMKDTSFDINDLDKNRLVTPYIYVLRKFIPLPNYEMDSACSAAGGLRTTILDLSNFLLAQINGGEYNGIRILEEQTVELMHTTQFPDSQGRHGLGWQIWRIGENGTSSLEGHMGEVPGGTAFMHYRSQEQIGILFFMNQFTRLKLSEFYYWMMVSTALFNKAGEL